MSIMVELIKQSQKGNESAFAAVIERFKNMAYGYAVSIIGDFHWAEDAAQEAFIEAWTCLPQLRAPEAFSSWFKKIVFKHCERFLRRKAHFSVNLETAVSIPSRELDDPAFSTLYEETKSKVIQAINRLPQAKRSVVTLFYLGGYKQEEIAHFLNVPVGTIKSRLYSARKALREEMVEMVEMVENTFSKNGLSETFTEDTLQKALGKASTLQHKNDYEKAERILKTALGHAPDHPGILRALNRNLMHGNVFGKGDWTRLAEIVSQARKILRSGSADETIIRETTKTLLCIPKMQEAISFIEEEWIERMGPSFEPLAMLAWAKGCVGDVDSARDTWGKASKHSDCKSKEDAATIQLGCLAIVDCLVNAGEPEMAKGIAQHGLRAGG